MTLKEFLVKMNLQYDAGKFEKLQSSLDGIKNRVGLLAGIEAGKAIFEFGEKFAEFGEKLHLAATSAGLTVESFQKLSFSAKQSGISQEEMSTSMFKLSKTLYQARQGGSEAQLAFSRVGITPEQVAGFKDGKDALIALSGRFQGMTDPIEKAALATQLMGRGSREMVGYLSKGPAALKASGDELEKFGGVLSTVQVEGLVKLEQSLQKIWAVTKAVAAGIAASLAPVLKLAIDDILGLWNTMRQGSTFDIHSITVPFAYGLGFMIGLIQRLVEWFHKYHDIIMTIGKAVGVFVAPALGLLALGKSVKAVVDTTGMVMKFAGAWKTFFTNPFVLLAVIVASIHDLYILLFKGGNLKDTWIGQLPFVAQFVEGLSTALAYLIEKVQGFIAHPLGSIFGTNEQDGVQKQVEKLRALRGAAGGINSIGAANPVGIANTSNVTGGNQYSVNAPITVHVPQGTPPGEVGKSVQRGIQEHLDRTLREANRSGKPARQY
jgi:hypothetical protein